MSALPVGVLIPALPPKFLINNDISRLRYLTCDGDFNTFVRAGEKMVNTSWQPGERILQDFVAFCENSRGCVTVPLLHSRGEYLRPDDLCIWLQGCLHMLEGYTVRYPDSWGYGVLHSLAMRCGAEIFRRVTGEPIVPVNTDDAEICES